MVAVFGVNPIMRRLGFIGRLEQAHSNAATKVGRTRDSLYINQIAIEIELAIRVPKRAQGAGHCVS
jgi:hypothetical protein